MKHIEQYEEEFSSVQNSCLCSKCKSFFYFEPDEVWWDEKGFGYSTKLVKHTECGCINVLNHQEDHGLNVNFDERFYEYK